MADSTNFMGLGDEENPHGGSKVLPCPTTPKFEAGRREDEKSKGPATFGQLVSERLALLCMGVSTFHNVTTVSTVFSDRKILLITLTGMASFGGGGRGHGCPRLPHRHHRHLFLPDRHQHPQPPHLLIRLPRRHHTPPRDGAHLRRTHKPDHHLRRRPLRPHLPRPRRPLHPRAVLRRSPRRPSPQGRRAPLHRGGPPPRGVETGQGLWLELICTFIFLYASIWLAFDGRQARAHGPVVVCSIVGAVLGFLVFISITVTNQKGYSGAGLNPARCIGPALVRGGYLWDDHWVYWVGPGIACVIFYLFIKISPPQHFQPDHDFKYDFLTTLKVLLMSSKSRK
ncbi:hypothetical protein H6P81_018840 [Aristolochia fimbriata]|uniref:Uncharacterized protein n=1 Tax=Aristolochia fimbriata TaxID=158543 RepID=A0AAV7E3M9_ARIFI|nr:hypothetical protein H6P81_018840 [Aristolochia fimbriata]